MCGILYLETDKKDKKEITNLFLESLRKLKRRGPDCERVIKTNKGYMGFERLSINGNGDSGMQPFLYEGATLITNGEIYNYYDLKKELEKTGYKFKGKSDCEVILPLYLKYGAENLFEKLDGEFAVVIEDFNGNIIAGRDPYGVRGMFYGKTKNGNIAFASEAKALEKLCEEVKPFPPAHYYYNGKFYKYNIKSDKEYLDKDIDEVLKNIHDKFYTAVQKRLYADPDVEYGFLLSGGLDSSLICGVAVKLLRRMGYNKPIHSFCIGMTKDSIDCKYASEVAEYVGTVHTNYYMTEEEIIKKLPRVINAIESFDTTTVRASIGMYLCCKKLKKDFPNIKVILTGEGSDEIFGYKYTDYAPSPEAFQKEAEKRVGEIYLYDALRADRCISAHGLEGRVPFLDKDFVDYCMYHIPAYFKMNYYQMGKMLLRLAFKDDPVIPYSILARNKEAFSDAVGASLVGTLKEYAQKANSDAIYKISKTKCFHMAYKTKEDLLYRQYFEFSYPDLNVANLIPEYWMPNQLWLNKKVTDPSATVLNCHDQHTDKPLSELYEILKEDFK